MKAARALCALVIVVASARMVAAQAPAAPQPATPGPSPAAQPATPAPARPVQTAPPEVAAAVAGGVRPPDNYVIGVEDVLVILFWRDKDMSSEATVRPDGKITLPLINDVAAAGLTPDELREKITKEAERFIEEPAASVIVKQINSRRVFITGEVEKPGPYNLTGPTTVLQLLSMAGGLREYAHRSDIVIMRMEAGRAVTFQFDYAAVAKRKKLQQNIQLKPGDTILVP